MITAISVISWALAFLPCVLFVRNLRLYRSLPMRRGVDSQSISVLIPARNEEANIANALHSVLQSHGIDFEVIVLDDNSIDQTAEIVRESAKLDPRVHLKLAQPLPVGWCGKTFACQQLAMSASHPLLLFIDADVRLARPDSLARLAQFFDRSDAALISGVPRQETRTFMERLVIPLIHFVLLGFLPLNRMRANADPRFAAACGQIVAVRRQAYQDAGGHAAIRMRLHDGVALARSFRTHGFRTDLFDGSDTFLCRMYRSAFEVWSGFGKNAHEGLASPRLILPSTLLLVGGQVLPLVMVFLVSSPLAFGFAAAGTLAAFLPRLVAVARFHQPLVGALCHPLGICMLVTIQWTAFIRSLRGRPTVWKGRTYPVAT